MGAMESGQSFLQGVLAKLPESQREAARAIFESAEAKDAVTLLGDGALARSDYSKHMDQLREKESALNEHYERLNTWYDVNKSALDEAKDLKSRGGGNPNLPPEEKPPLQSPAFSPQEVRKIADEAVNETARDQIAVSAFIATTAAQHYAMFGEPLNAMDLIANPKLGRPVAGQPGRIFSLQDAYHERYGERVLTKQKEAEDKRFNDEVEKRLAERTKSQSTHPFPLRNESSPLDVLQTKDGPAAHTLDSAVAEYERLQSARGS
jgi:hypothetical protein